MTYTNSCGKLGISSKKPTKKFYKKFLKKSHEKRLKMNKTCSSGSPCQYRHMETGTVGFGCSYEGYCDYQLPRDSRPMTLTPVDGKKEDKEDNYG